MAHRMEGTLHTYFLNRVADKTVFTENGFITIDTVDPLSGQISGTYKDLGGGTKPITGVVLSGLSDVVIVEHEIPGAPTKFRHYEGTLVAEGKTPRDLIFRVVAGKFRGYTKVSPPTPERSGKDITADAAAQEEGTWVGTQP